MNPTSAPIQESAEENPENPSARPAWSVGARYLFGRLCFGGLVVALGFFCLSLTPSLLPRSPLFQGLVSGASTAIGYGLGSAISAGIRQISRQEPSQRSKRIAWRLLLGGSVLFLGIFAWYGAQWQEDVRSLMGMGQLRSYHWLLIAAIAATIALVLLGVARIVRGLTRLAIKGLARFIPKRIAVGVGVVLAALILYLAVTDVLFGGVVSVVNSAYAKVNGGTSHRVTQSTSELRTGGPESFVSWASLGTEGHDFTGDGGSPTVAEIETFTKEPALAPVRVYIGIESADTLKARTRLAVRELERTGGFDRAVLVIYAATGTGWIDPIAANAIDYMYGGNTAGVGMQYSFLPSWISFLVDSNKAADTSRALTHAVVSRVAQLPPGDRPDVLVFGESLGSFGAESAFPNIEDLLARTDGTLLVGPTFQNPIHDRLRAQRDEPSPFWRPLMDGGKHVRSAIAPSELTDPSLYPKGSAWTMPRVAYLQNSSDPVGYFEPSLLWKSPEWLEEPRGPDVSDSIRWIPFVTFAQVGADLAAGGTVPVGHGHVYRGRIVDGWAQLLDPAGWTSKKTEDLKTLLTDGK